MHLHHLAIPNRHSSGLRKRISSHVEHLPPKSSPKPTSIPTPPSIQLHPPSPWLHPSHHNRLPPLPTLPLLILHIRPHPPHRPALPNRRLRLRTTHALRALLANLQPTPLLLHRHARRRQLHPRLAPAPLLGRHRPRARRLRAIEHQRRTTAPDDDMWLCGWDVAGV